MFSIRWKWLAAFSLQNELPKGEIWERSAAGLLMDLPLGDAKR